MKCDQRRGNSLPSHLATVTISFETAACQPASVMALLVERLGLAFSDSGASTSKGPTERRTLLLATLETKRWNAHLEQRRLAAAVDAHKSQLLSLAHRQRYVFELKTRPVEGVAEPVCYKELRGTRHHLHFRRFAPHRAWGENDNNYNYR